MNQNPLSRIGGNEFQQLCSVLLQRLFPTLRAVDGSGGDEGVDAWIPESRTYFQFHAPAARVRRDKFERYLRQASAHDPQQWIFVTNQDFTRAQWKWFENYKSQTAFHIEAWTASVVISKLQQHPDLAGHYLSSDRRESIIIGSQKAHAIHNIVAENVTLVGRRPLKPKVYIPGVVSNDKRKVGYLKYLARLFNEYKERELGKGRMRYPMIYVNYRKEIGYNLEETPLEQFDDAALYLQGRLLKSKVGRMRTALGEKLFDSFAEFQNR